jgi:hypothetical protein
LHGGGTDIKQAAPGEVPYAISALSLIIGTLPAAHSLQVIAYEFTRSNLYRIGGRQLIDRSQITQKRSLRSFCRRQILLRLGDERILRVKSGG